MPRRNRWDTHSFPWKPRGEFLRSMRIVICGIICKTLKQARSLAKSDAEHECKGDYY